MKFKTVMLIAVWFSVSMQLLSKIGEPNDGASLTSGAAWLAIVWLALFAWLAYEAGRDSK